MNILVIEDELTDFLLVEHAIERLGGAHRVLHAEGCRQALRAIEAAPISLALVDLLLPDGDGYKISELLKNREIPFVMVTSKSLPEHAVRCLKSGAEDYIRKPFDVEELAARLECVLRRTQPDAPLPAPPAKAKGGVPTETLHIDLTPIENRLLTRLRLGYDTYIASSELIETVWGPTSPETAKGALRTYISHIRKKLSQARSPLVITSKWGRGYKLTKAGEAEA